MGCAGFFFTRNFLKTVCAVVEKNYVAQKWQAIVKFVGEEGREGMDKKGKVCRVYRYVLH